MSIRYQVSFAKRLIIHRDRGDWRSCVFNLIIETDGSVCLLGFASKQNDTSDLRLLSAVSFFCLIPQSDIIICIRQHSFKASFMSCVGIVVSMIGHIRLLVSCSRAMISKCISCVVITQLDTSLGEVFSGMLKWTNEARTAQTGPTWPRQVTLTLEKPYGDATRRQEPKRIFTQRQWITVFVWVCLRQATLLALKSKAHVLKYASSSWRFNYRHGGSQPRACHRRWWVLFILPRCSATKADKVSCS